MGKGHRFLCGRKKKRSSYFLSLGPRRRRSETAAKGGGGGAKPFKNGGRDRRRPRTEFVRPFDPCFAVLIMEVDDQGIGKWTEGRRVGRQVERFELRGERDLLPVFFFCSGKKFLPPLPHGKEGTKRNETNFLPLWQTGKASGEGKKEKLNFYPLSTALGREGRRRREGGGCHLFFCLCRCLFLLFSLTLLSSPPFLSLFSGSLSLSLRDGFFFVPRDAHSI